MKRNRTLSVVFYLFAVAFDILAIFNFSRSTGMGVTWLCLGAMFMCLGTLFLRKSQNNDDHSNSDHDSGSGDK